MMVGNTRESSFLPTIKCSMCAQEIEISMMGDHVCGAAPEPTPPLDPSSNFRINPYKQPLMNSQAQFKSGKLPPPRVDTSAANRPFVRQDTLTPLSASSESRSASPMTPNDGRRSPYLQAPGGRSINNQSSPDDNPSLPYDSPFPSFPPTKKSPMNDSFRTRTESKREKYPEDDAMYAPASPMPIGTGGLLQRMNTIAPGPFDINGRRGKSRDERPLPQREQLSRSISNDDKGHAYQNSKTSSGHSRSSTADSAGYRPGLPVAPVPKLERLGGYGGFGPPEDKPRELLGPNRSQTFPTASPSQSASLPRRPSEAAPRMRRPSNDNQPDPTFLRTSPPRDGRRPSTSNSNSRPPPRGLSVSGRSVSSANLNLAAEFGAGNPYHTPSISQSSNESGVSLASKTSSRSSPPSSAEPRMPRRRPSDTTGFDGLMNDLQAMKSPVSKSPPRMQYANAMPPPRSLDPSLLSPESPMDPAIQGNRLSPIPRKQSSQPMRKPEPKLDPPAQRRPSTSKGDCKACREPIKGKSISSADGRLTGRYHKQCFVCTTCAEPFATATFYVINDAPYCERHYHKLNNSMCTNCDRGIEGQYLETQRKQKFHPNCLTCVDCRRVLRDDYFEMGGRVYCERDAYRKAQQRNFLGAGGKGGLGSNRMERRTTRLMMI